MKIIIGSDHAGYELKKGIVEYVNSLEISIDDNNIEYVEGDDYPDMACAVAKKVASNEYDRGIIICGSGIGGAIVANKINGIRCGTCNDEYLVKMGRADNNMNILSLGARVIDLDTAKRIVKIFIETDFLGERHQRRLDKISEIEKNR